MSVPVGAETTESAEAPRTRAAPGAGAAGPAGRPAGDAYLAEILAPNPPTNDRHDSLC